MLQPSQTPKEKKNTKDATQMKGMRPVFKGPNSKLPQPKNLSGTAKNGKSFPDLNKDGKITKADVLKGRGVIAKTGTSVPKKNSVSKNIGNLNKAKSGKTMKICKGGC